MSGGGTQRDPARVVAIFDAALDRPADERPAFVAAACGDDRSLVAEVLELLGAHETSGDFLEGPVDGTASIRSAAASIGAALPPPEPAPDEDPDLGTRLGPWRLEAVLGRGGMGCVYRARRDDGAYDADVAVKLLPAGSAGAMPARRLERERRVLASLEHPEIARLLDGGIAPDGRPYLVMELVNGRRIDAAADERRLDARGRVAWLLVVAEAVAHAHRQLVVHRDLKPANVLVRQDGRPVLLDFGIARVLGDTGGDVTGTMPGMMTPRYAAPEQQRGEAPSVAMDVFALGMLLHALLIGEPSDPATGLPADPAAAWARLGPEARRSLAGARASTPAGYGRILAGDLGRIVMRATSPDPADRYADAATFAADLARWLEGRPALAARPGIVRHASSFLRRHRTASAFGAAAVIGLSVGVGGLVTGYARAKTARVEAEREAAISAATERFLERLLGSAKVENASGRVPPSELRVIDVLDQAGPAATRDLADRPEVEARVRQLVGEVLHGYGESERALPHLQRAVALGEASRGPTDNVTLRALGMLGRVEARLGRRADAEVHLRAVLDRRAALDGTESASALMALNDLGRMWIVAGDDARAAKVFADVHATAEEVLGPDHDVTLLALNNVASSHDRAGRHAQAVACQQQVVDRLAGRLGQRQVRTLNARRSLATLLSRAGREDEALAISGPLVEAARESFGETNYVTLTAMALDARLRWAAVPVTDAAARRAALDDHAAAIDRLCTTVSAAHPTVLRSIGDHAAMLAGSSDPAGAVADIEPWVTQAATKIDVAARAPRLLLAFAGLLAESGDDAAATERWRAIQAATGDDERRRGSWLEAEHQLALFDAREGRLAEARRRLERTYSERLERFGPDDPATRRTAEALAALDPSPDA